MVWAPPLLNTAVRLHLLAVGLTAHAPTTGVMNEPLRKAVHLIFGLAIACFILFSERKLALYALVIALFTGFILSDALSRGYTIPGVSKIIATLERRDVLPGKGALFFALGALFSLTFFPKEVTFIGLVVLALLDSVTTLVGLRFGRTRIYNHKSIEATLAGFAATTAALLFLIPAHAAILTSAAAAFAELVSPVDDNLIVPAVVCIVLTVLF